MVKFFSMTAFSTPQKMLFALVDTIMNSFFIGYALMRKEVNTELNEILYPIKEQ